MKNGHLKSGARVVQGHPKDPSPLDHPPPLQPAFVKVEFHCYAIFMSVTKTEAMYERSCINVKIFKWGSTSRFMHNLSYSASINPPYVIFTSDIYCTVTHQEKQWYPVLQAYFWGAKVCLFMNPGCHLWFYDRWRLERVELLYLGVGVRVKEGDGEGDFSLPTPPPLPWLASTSLLFCIFNMAVFLRTK